MHGKWSLFRGAKVREIENEFAKLFPNSPESRPMESKFPLVRYEMELYQSALRTQKKWHILELDLFAILRGAEGKDLQLLLQNTQEMGNRLWQVIYQSSQIKKCVELLGIDFGNIKPLFDNEIVHFHSGTALVDFPCNPPTQPGQRADPSYVSPFHLTKPNLHEKFKGRQMFCTP